MVLIIPAQSEDRGQLAEQGDRDGQGHGQGRAVVRRLRAEPIVVLAADRLDRDRHLNDFFSRTVLGDSLMTTGLPERLAGLEPDAAAALLTEHAPCSCCVPAPGGGRPSPRAPFGITSRAELVRLAAELT